LGQLTVKNRQIAATTACIFLAILTTGCATVTGGTTQSVSVKTQKDAVDVAGANCALSNSKGNWTLTTPGTVSVHRAKDDLNIHCWKDGEGDVATAIQSSTRKGAYYAGNLIMFGIVGGALITGPIDRATGAKYAYPDDIIVSFGNDPEPQEKISGVTQDTKAQLETAPAANATPSLSK
jgi:hypothetical protein